MDHALPLNGDIPVLSSEGASAVVTRRKPKGHEDTESLPRLPSQWVVDAVFAGRQLGLGGSILLIIVLSGYYGFPWFGTNIAKAEMDNRSKLTDAEVEERKSIARSMRSLSESVDKQYEERQSDKEDNRMLLNQVLTANKTLIEELRASRKVSQ